MSVRANYGPSAAQVVAMSISRTGEEALAPLLTTSADRSPLVSPIQLLENALLALASDDASEQRTRTAHAAATAFARECMFVGDPFARVVERIEKMCRKVFELKRQYDLLCGQVLMWACEVYHRPGRIGA